MGGGNKLRGTFRRQKVGDGEWDRWGGWGGTGTATSGGRAQGGGLVARAVVAGTGRGTSTPEIRWGLKNSNGRNIKTPQPGGQEVRKTIAEVFGTPAIGTSGQKKVEKKEGYTVQSERGEILLTEGKNPFSNTDGGDQFDNAFRTGVGKS